MKRIIRVFPRRTSYTPDDDMVFIGYPPIPQLIPEHDEIHISCTFTWDMDLCEDLAYQWESVTNKPVKLGGVAYGSPVDGFDQGMYVKKNIIFTSRGCNNHCRFCMVHDREGSLRELPICEGNIIQDNNFLQCSRQHKDKVFEMLRKQRGICFKGGLEVDLIDDHFVESIRSLSIRELWLACDSDAVLPSFRKAMEKLKMEGFKRWMVHCYSLIGHDMEKEEARNREIWLAGAMPFSQLEMDFGRTKKIYSKEWQDFQRRWQREAIISKRMREIFGDDQEHTGGDVQRQLFVFNPDSRNHTDHTDGGET